MSQHEVLEASMDWMDDLWDDDAALLWNVRREQHLVRETGLYALGSLMRGDTDRAVRAIDAVCDHQFDRPGTPYHGTWRRAPQEADPPDDPVMWIHYDPNWRQFIGTNLALILDRFDVPDETEHRIRAAITLAVDGEPADRISPSYANIALMRAWLDAWAGHTARADTFAQATFDAFNAHGAFLEYNSPTYYGIDLYALALWRDATPLMRDLGSRIEAALWRDIARFYHAGMRTQCGPYDRAYGMDMRTHATPLGLWIWSAVGRKFAPFPVGERFRHPHDMCFGPVIAAFEAQVPSDVLPDFTGFRGERLVEQVVTSDPHRAATAWIGEDVMLGAWSGPHSGIGWFQHHHATAHRRLENGTTGWLRLRPEVTAEVVVEPGRLLVSTPADASDPFESFPDLTTCGFAWSRSAAGPGLVHLITPVRKPL